MAVGDDRRPFGPFGRGWSLHRHRVFAASLRLTLATAAVSLTHAVPFCFKEMLKLQLRPLRVQVSENRHMNKIIGEILSADGNECYMKDARIYAAEDEELSFWQVTARARGLQHVVLGYRLFESNEVAPTLNPKERDVKRKWHENDVIVVLGED